MNKFKPYLYGAYGSNLNRQQMAFRCPSAVPCETILLNDWELVFRGVADIQPKSGKSLTLGLWMITDDCETSLDRYEGFPNLYTKQIIQTLAGDVMVYVMCDSNDVYPPSTSYLSGICEGYDNFNIDKASLKEALDHSYCYQSI